MAAGALIRVTLVALFTYFRSVARGPLGTSLTRKATELAASPPAAALKWISCHSGLFPSGATRMALMG